METVLILIFSVFLIISLATFVFQLYANKKLDTNIERLNLLEKSLTYKIDDIDKRVDRLTYENQDMRQRYNASLLTFKEEVNERHKVFTRNSSHYNEKTREILSALLNHFELVATTLSATPEKTVIEPLITNEPKDLKE